MAVSAAESAIATVVGQVRGVTSSIGPADHAARTLTAPVTEAIHAAVAPVSESLPLTRVADALGAALAPVQDTLRLPAEVRAPRVVTALTPLIDDGPWASAGAPVADAPARQGGGSAGMTLGIVGGSDRAAVLPEGHFGAWSPTLSLASEAHAQDVAGSGARTGQHTVPTERDQRVAPPLVVGAADPAPVPEAPAPFPTPPAVAPAAGAASATNNGHGCVATAIRARVTVPEPSTAVDAGVVPAVLDQAQDPGFSPG